MIKFAILVVLVILVICVAVSEMMEEEWYEAIWLEWLNTKK